MDRRSILASLAFSIVAVCGAAHAQPARKLYRIGILSAGFSTSDLVRQDRHESGLQSARCFDRGFLPGRRLQRQLQRAGPVDHARVRRDRILHAENGLSARRRGCSCSAASWKSRCRSLSRFRTPTFRSSTRVPAVIMISVIVILAPAEPAASA